MFKVECICGNCGEPVKISLYEIVDGRLILTINEEHVCFDEEDGGDEEEN